MVCLNFCLQLMMTKKITERTWHLCQSCSSLCACTKCSRLQWWVVAGELTTQLQLGPSEVHCWKPQTEERDGNCIAWRNCPSLMPAAHTWLHEKLDLPRTGSPDCLESMPWLLGICLRRVNPAAERRKKNFKNKKKQTKSKPTYRTKTYKQKPPHFFSCIAERARDIVGQLLEIRNEMKP